ncbi:M20 family metallopeptidase [Aquibacillus koreensis]|uniref:M20 family metallopeptidase n=1 Tax=Aquibacillus koreensis TaxID=279446 RepID=A0A9X3WMD8_9BACI|nr:M20 family metallopeptidase [Aquibacillus koreensis]MCT2537091.1 M20 family metallopeptidase [Aquibacillus koreensis]MDC3419926.1 M20 family metallopeptidase [Aquibacillus koreensis]
MSKILTYLINNQHDIEETLLQLVEAESPSKNKMLTDKCGLVLKESFETLVGGKVEIIEKEAVGNQYRFTYGDGTETEQILIIGHYDTVWDQGAIPIRKEDGKLYGPGTFDMKGGLAVTLWALKALKEFGHFGKRKVVFLVTSDEEIGSEHSRALIEEEARKSEMVFVPESSISHSGAVKTFRKGIGIFKLIVHGKSVHAGIDPWSGASAIDELALQIADIKSLDNKEEGVSINIGTISGGTRTNVVAGYAEADIDLRFRTKDQAHELEHALLDRSSFIKGTMVEMQGGINRYPLEKTDSVMGLYQQMKEIALRHGYELEQGSSGGASDGNLTAGLGIPTIDGLGPVGDGAHAENEHVVLENLPYRAALIAELIKRNSR